mgnify:CR=1 FL=1
MKRKLLGYAIATVILGVIFWRIDRAEFVRLVSIMDWTWFAAGMAMFIPAYLVVVARLRFMFNGQLSFRDALTSILAASSLNIILPSKGGDTSFASMRAAYAARRYFDFKTVIPCHYRTFPLLAQNADVLKAALPGVDVIGETGN